MSRVRLVPIVLIAVLALAVLFGSWQAYQHFKLLSPLKQNLQQVEGVQKVSIFSGNPDVIQIKLGPFKKLKDEDLQQTYHDIRNQISSRLGQNATIHLTADHNAKLDGALEHYQPFLHEGIAKGNYVEMIRQVTQMAKSQGIQARITMDKQYIYIQLQTGSHYLYSVMSYSSPPGGAAS